VSGHTALVLDLERRTASVHGLGGVTVRAGSGVGGGRSAVIPAGSEVPLVTLDAIARDLAAGDRVDPAAAPGADRVHPAARLMPPPRPAPLRDATAELEGSFSHALTG
jgi:hypothetical protein